MVKKHLAPHDYECTICCDTFKRKTICTECPACSILICKGCTEKTVLSTQRVQCPDCKEPWSVSRLMSFTSMRFAAPFAKDQWKATHEQAVGARLSRISPLLRSYRRSLELEEKAKQRKAAFRKVSS